jgi:hypothetical protein
MRISEETNLALQRRASSHVTGAILIVVVGLAIGVGLFVSLYVAWGPSTKTTTEIQTVTETITSTVTNVVTSPGSTGGGSNLVTVSGNLLVPTGTTTGSLVLNIKNSANNPITGIIASFPTGSASFTGAGGIAANCMGQTTAGVACAVGAVTFNFNGAIIQTSNPLPIGSETSAVDTVTQQVAGALRSGQTYSIAVTVTFADGSPQTQLLSITAQL